MNTQRELLFTVEIEFRRRIEMHRIDPLVCGASSCEISRLLRFHERSFETFETLFAVNLDNSTY